MGQDKKGRRSDSPSAFQGLHLFNPQARLLSNRVGCFVHQSTRRWCDPTSRPKAGGCFSFFLFFKLAFFLQRMLRFFLLLLSAFICFPRFTRTSHIPFSYFEIIVNYSMPDDLCQASMPDDLCQASMPDDLCQASLPD